MTHHMLSDKQYEFLTSQNSEIKGESEQKSRIVEKSDEMMNTLRIILNSKNIDQQFKDEVFPKHRITSLIDNLIRYDDENTALDEQNKQAIVLDLMGQCLRYFQDRYKEVFIRKEIKTFEQFAEDITTFTGKQIDESRAQELFKTRQSLTPPLLYPTKDYWTAMCDECHRYSDLGKNEEDAINRVNHTKGCTIRKERKRMGKDDVTFKERIKIQYYKITPPLKKSKKA